MKRRSWFEKLSKFFSLVKYHKWDYLFSFLQAFIRWINPLIHVIFIEQIVYALSKNDIELLSILMIYYWIVVVFYELLMIFTRNVWWVKTIPNWEKQIYDMYLKRYIQMDNNSVEKVWVWKIIAILENGRLRWADGLATSIERWIALLILLVYVFFITFSHWLIFTLWFFLLLIFSIIVLVMVNNHQFKYRNRRSEYRNDRLRLITKVLMSKNEILQTNRIDNEVDKIAKLCDETSKVNIEMSIWRIFQNRTIPFIVGFSLFLFVFFYWKLVISWDMEISKFVAITSIFLVVNSSVYNFLIFYIDMSKDFIDIEKMWDFFENTPSLVWYELWKNFTYKKAEIKLKNVTYAYHKWKNVFQDFNLEIEWWKITALVWNSGSGKTTLVKLISGYIKADLWDIIIDKQKLSEISLKSYYNFIGYLSQEPSVFDWTVLENLTYAVNKDVSEDELNDVIEQSGCDFIYDLPKWLDTEIWEKWIRLSGWQRQRLAIAKIMLKNPKIIILDEPTSALDSFSEEKITKALHNLFIWRTVIIIAHRLQTVKHADRIIVMENGKIVEEWNHKTLIESKWIYKKMLDLQSGF